MHGVRRLGGRDDPFAAGKSHGGREHLALRVGLGPDEAVDDELGDERRHAVVAEPAGVDRRGDEVVTERVHGYERGQLAGVAEVADSLAREAAEKAAQVAAGALDAKRSGADVKIDEVQGTGQTQYEFMPDPDSLLNELLPLAVKTALFQAFLDAATSEHVARMVSMKSATDNADKMAKALTMQYNRARQSQITTELSEIMGGVEAMKS